MSPYSIHVDYDPCGVSWLGQDPDLSPAERATAFEKIDRGELEIYEVILFEDCPTHGRECMEHAKELRGAGYQFGENGHHGVYSDPRDIREEGLRRLADRLIAGLSS